MKKIISVLMAIVILFSYAAAENREAAQEQLNRKNLDFLTDIGLLDGISGKFANLSEEATRAEFISLAVKLAAADEVNGEAAFSDVSDSHWAAVAIKSAAALKLISNAAEFYPDETITLAQADKITVAALGYAEYAEANGGWPSGYIAQANTLRLNRGVTSAEKLTRYDALCIIRNALETDIMTISSVGNSREYESLDGRTPLNEYYDIYKTDGIVESNGLTALRKAAVGTRGNKIKVNGETYFAGNTDIGEYIGMKVKFYYKDNDDDFTVVHIDDTSHNTVVTVMSDDIISYSNNEFKYYDENEKIKSLKVSPALSVIYNGQTLIDYTNDNIIIKNGEINMIDNNEDDIYEVAVSYDYENYYVDSVNTDLKLVIDESSGSGGTRVLNLDDTNTVRIFDEAGALSGFEKISRDSMLTVFKSHDGKYIDVYTACSSAEGVISEAGTDENERTVTIGNNKIPVDKMYKKDIKLNSAAVVYMNAYGRAAYIKYNDEDRKIGYLIKYKKSGTMEDLRQVKLLNEDGELIPLDLVTKAKLNGRTIDDNNEKELWNESLPNSDNRRPVVYKINKENKITEIFTTERTCSSDAEKEVRMVYKASEQQSYYRADDGMFIITEEMGDNIFPHYYTSAEIVHFGVPTNADADEKDYIIYDVKNRNAGLPLGRVNLYALKDSRLISISEVLYNSGDDSVSWGDTAYAVVTELKNEIDEKGDEITSFVNIINGMKMYIDDDTKLRDIHDGDMILYTVNTSTKAVMSAKKLYCKNADAAYTVTYGSHGRRGMKGVITGFSENVYSLKADSGETLEFRPKAPVIDMRKKKAVTTSADAIAVGDEIAVYFSEAVPLCTLIIK